MGVFREVDPRPPVMKSAGVGTPKTPPSSVGDAPERSMSPGWEEGSPTALLGTEGVWWLFVTEETRRLQTGTEEARRLQAGTEKVRRLQVVRRGGSTYEH